MQKNVIVKVNTVNRYEEDRDTFCVEREGLYYEKNGKHYCRYEDEDSVNMIKIDADTVEISRRSKDIDSKYTYLKNERIRALCVTGYGRMDVEIYTKDLNIQIAEDNIKIDISYDAYAGEQIVSQNEVSIEIG